ncbi:MAG TPA: YfiR family protein [Methylomirabilota bacterium]|nr:YfiR family protein [Methylomirabilota bacterium]
MIGGKHSRAWRAVMAAGWLIVLTVAQGRAAPPATEAELKAVLLFHLTQFVTWPAASSNQTEFVIGILGPDPFGPALDSVIKGETVGGRPIRVIRYNRARDLIGSSLVYVSPQARGSPSRIFEEFKTPPVLTVGESTDFLHDGGMIRFKRTSERKIRLEIQLTRARESGLNINAQLLRVSDVVEGGGR